MYISYHICVLCMYVCIYVLCYRVASSCEFLCRSFKVLLEVSVFLSQESLFLDAGHWKSIESLCICHENDKGSKVTWRTERVLVLYVNKMLILIISLWNSFSLRESDGQHLQLVKLIICQTEQSCDSLKAEYALGATLHVIISITMTEQLRWNVF